MVKKLEIREFKLGPILTTMTGFFICGDIRYVYELLNFLYGPSFSKITAPLIQNQTAEYLYNKYPRIRALTDDYMAWHKKQHWEEQQDIEEKIKHLQKFMQSLKKQYGDTIEIQQMSDKEIMQILLQG